MKNMKNKTTKNNMINYGIVIVLFVIVQASYGTSCSPLCLYHCISFPEPGSRVFR